MAAARSPEGALAPPGAMTFQKSEWLTKPPPLLRTAPWISFGSEPMSAMMASALLPASSALPSMAALNLSV